MKQLKLYQIDMKYIRDLHNADNRVPSVSPQIGKHTRIFVGIVVTHQDRQYCIPLSHPKEKHHKMSNNAELQKIYDKDKLIAVLNFNLMIPVTSAQLIPVNLKITPQDSPSTKARKTLCVKELKWCRKNEIIIYDKAKNIYNLYLYEPKFKGKQRCLDFPRLEKICDKYNKSI